LADVSTTTPDEPPVTVVETFENGVNGWKGHSKGLKSLEITGDHATEGEQCLRLDLDVLTWDEMAHPTPGIEKYGMDLDWSAYWPDGTLKLDVYIPEFQHPEAHPER